MFILRKKQKRQLKKKHRTGLQIGTHTFLQKRIFSDNTGSKKKQNKSDKY